MLSGKRDTSVLAFWLTCHPLSNTGSDLADLINGYIKDGKIVPVKITCGLIEKAMTDSGNSKFLIDGFPRNQDNFDGRHFGMLASGLPQAGCAGG